MSSKRIVLEEIPSGGSPHGLSSLLTALECPRKYQLDKQWEGDRAGTGAKVGTALHALMSPYYVERTPHVSFAGHLQDEITKEAQRLFDGYKKRFPPELVGKVIGAEIDLPTPIDTLEEGPLAGEPVYAPGEIVAVEREVAVWPTTGRTDLVIELDTQQCAALCAARPSLGGIEPGVWLWDFKTTSKCSSNWLAEYQMKWQFKLYPVLWNALHEAAPDRYPGECRGIIADIIVKHKTLTDKSFYAVAVQCPAPWEKRALRNLLSQARQATLTNDTRALDCFQWGRVCYHYTTGMCPRY